MTPLIKPPPELRGGNLSYYQDRSPESVNHGPAGTGKSLTALFKLVHLALIFPKTRWFLVRKTKVSLVESALVTLERDVFGEDSPMLLQRPMMRKTRDYYTFPNGSVIVTAGMDKPEKLFSTEYNGGYVQEATELEQDEWQSLKRALRAPFTVAVKLVDGPTPVPFYQLWGDCNPSYAHHWLKKRIDSGVTSGHRSFHEDNPRFYDLINKEWKPDGKEYLQNQLGGLVGFMADRLLRGIWSLAEGLVYDGWDERIHLIEPYAKNPDGTYDITKPTIQPSWPRYWVIDWGGTSPTVLQMWAKDGDGRIYLYREWYRAKYLVEDLADWAKNEVAMGREPRPVAVITDHDPLNEGAFARRSGFPTIQADKAGLKRTHVQSPMARVKVQKDGRPRMFVVKGYQAHPAQPELAKAGKPTCFTEEIVAYTWDADKDTPVDKDDHACFVAGTMVETEHGERPIESIKCGDNVLTRSGFRRVIASGITSQSARVITAKFSDGRSLTGTPNHPVFVDGIGFTRMDTISYGDILITPNGVSKWKSFHYRKPTESSGFVSMGLFIEDTRSRRIPATETTFEPGLEIALEDEEIFTAMSGFTIGGKFQKNTRFTTKTKTRPITKSKTWNCSRCKLTGKCTAKNHRVWQLPIWSECEKTALMPSCFVKQRIGTAVKRDSLGIAKTRRECTPKCRAMKKSARFAGISILSNFLCEIIRDIAETTADQKGGDDLVLMMLKRHAQSAKSNSSLTNMQRRNAAPVSVVRLVSEERTRPVYNLTVEDCPEYFANGVLVHNCDCFSYVSNYVDTKGSGGWGIR